MISDRNPNVFDFSPATASSGTSTAVPQVSVQQTTANLAAGANIEFDFSADTGPIFDAFVFADQILDIYIYMRQGSSDTFRLLDNAIYASGTANVLKQLIQGFRAAGTQVRIRITNNTGVATTTLSAQVHSRSM